MGNGRSNSRSSGLEQTVERVLEQGQQEVVEIIEEGREELVGAAEDIGDAAKTVTEAAEGLLVATEMVQETSEGLRGLTTKIDVLGVGAMALLVQGEVTKSGVTGLREGVTDLSREVRRVGDHALMAEYHAQASHGHIEKVEALAREVQEEVAVVGVDLHSLQSLVYDGQAATNRHITELRSAITDATLLLKSVLAILTLEERLAARQ